MANSLSKELLGQLDFKVLAVQRTKVGRWWNYRHVVSPFSRLWLILGGQANVWHHGRKFTLFPGCLHLIPPFTEHRCYCPNQLDHYHLHFTARQRTGLELFSLLNFDFQIPAARETWKGFQRIEALCPNRKLPCFDPAREEYRRQPTAAEQADREMNASEWFETRGILMMLLAPFLRSASLHTGVHARVTGQFLTLQEFIQANLGNKIELPDLARVVQLHPTYFSDRFKQVVGVRPLDYLMRRRIERAQYLLVTSRASIKEIAGAVGLPDAAHFCRVFTRLCHVSPSVYRARHTA